MPFLYAGLLGLTGSYAIGFIVSAVPALLVGFDLLRASGPRTRGAQG
jgi:hypothetical protein